VIHCAGWCGCRCARVDRADHRGRLRIDQGLLGRFGGLRMRSAASALRSAPSSSANQSCTQLRFFSPYWWSRNPSTVEGWACGECAFSAAGCEALGSGSMCRWRRSAVVRIPAFRAGDRDGLHAATRVGRHSQRSKRLNASSAEAAGGASAANSTSSMVPNYKGGQIVTGLSRGAKHGATEGDALRRSRHVGGSRDFGGTGRNGLGDWLSAAVVAIGALAVLGE